MIKLQDYTPNVYYNDSRDFQFIGRLFDIALNYAKTNAELIYNLPLSDNSDDQFVELLAYTLGFQPKHKYTSKHLRAVCSTLADIFRNKGTIKAVKLACNAIFNAEGIDEDLDYELKNNSTLLVLYLPASLKDTSLLNDLFDYILPAGLCCTIVKLVQDTREATTALGFAAENKLYPYNDSMIRNKAADDRFDEIDADTELGSRIEDNNNAFVNSFVYKPDDGE